MKKIFLILALILSVSLSAQTVNKFERIPNDDFQIHCNLHSLETSDGNIVLMEECFDKVDGESIDRGVNLLKINKQGELVKSTFVEFTAIQYHNPFIRNPFESNSNLMAGFYFNEDEDKYYYTAVFFDDDLNITKTVDTPVEAEGFHEYCILLFDENSKHIVMTYKSKSEENTYVYAKMDIYGKIVNINYSSNEEYATTRLVTNPLFIYSTEPLQYGCTFIDNNATEESVNHVMILDENMEMVESKELGIGFSEDYKFAIGAERNFVGMKDGTIVDASKIYSTTSDNNNHLQITKYDNDLNVKVYDRIRGGWNTVEGGERYDEILLSPCDDGVYVVWRYYDKKEYTYRYYVSKFDNELTLEWEREFETSESFLIVYECVTLEEGGLAINGYIDEDEAEDNVIFCYIISDDGNVGSTLSTSEYGVSVLPYNVYPNPAEDMVNISCSSDVKCEKVQIFGMDGKLYHEQNLDMSTINVDGLSTGIYMMKIQLSNGISYTEKLVVE